MRQLPEKNPSSENRIIFQFREPETVSYMGFQMVKIFLTQVTPKGQRSRSNPKNFEVEYLENGTR